MIKISVFSTFKTFKHFCSGMNLKIYDHRIPEAPNKMLIPHCSEFNPPFENMVKIKNTESLPIDNNSKLRLQKSQIKP